MKAHHYIAIALKIFSLTLAIYSIRFISPLFESLQYGTVNGMVFGGWFALLNLATVWIMAALLWMFPLTVSKRILKSELDLDVEPLATPSMFTVIVASIGLYTLANGGIDLVYWAIYLRMASENTFQAADPHSISSMIATILEFLVGLFLVLKCRTVVGYINKVGK